MKLKLLLVALIALILIQMGCAKKPLVEIPKTDAPAYKSSCTISEVYWLNDNESILLNDFCNGTLKKVNTETKSVELFDLVARGHLIQRLFYSEQLPQFAFYIAMTKDATGSYSPPFKLFSINLTNGAAVMIKDSITENPTVGLYVLGGKKLAIKSDTQWLSIDLEQSTWQTIPIAGDVQAFSPDDTKMLIYSSTTLLTGSVYDFNCQCLQPITLSGTGKAIWRTQGLFGYTIAASSLTSRSLKFQNLQSGTVLKTFTEFIEGPWIAQKGSLSVFLEKTSSWAADYVTSLKTYDLITDKTKELTTLPHNPSSFSILGIYLAAVSPDQKKVAYVQNATDLKVSVLQP